MPTVPSINLEQLRQDYCETKGKPFTWFFCPMLFKDEPVETCEGDVIGEPYINTRITQRKDVDNFFGTVAEADFGVLSAVADKGIKDVFISEQLRKKVRPKIIVDGVAQEYYQVKKKRRKRAGAIPEEHTTAQFNHATGDKFEFILKMRPDEVFLARDKSWQVMADNDYRLSSVISLIKAAFLTLFHMFGYRYALSGAGYSVGYQILGEFFRRCKGNPETAKQTATSFFREYIHMVRPMDKTGANLFGTLEDGVAYTCHTKGGARFGFGVIIRTNNQLHVVLMPMFDEIEAIPLYLDFLKNDVETIGIKPCQYNHDLKCWEASYEQPQVVTWPKAGKTFKFD
jgi:hypothetical protein